MSVPGHFPVGLLTQMFGLFAGGTAHDIPNHDLFEIAFIDRFCFALFDHDQLIG
jgi:hypothetical protein